MATAAVAPTRAAAMLAAAVIATIPSPSAAQATPELNKNV